jgi:hypothetical protein
MCTSNTGNACKTQHCSVFAVTVAMEKQQCVFFVLLSHFAVNKVTVQHCRKNAGKVSFALLSSYKIFRTAANNMKVLHLMWTIFLSDLEQIFSF